MSSSKELDPSISNDSPIRKTFQQVSDNLRKPTDLDIVDRLKEDGIRTVVSVPCSITASMDSEWHRRSLAGQMCLIHATHEHSLPGIAAGVYLGTGELPLLHMQNSGVTNASDGIISFARVYKIPTLALVTWRGSNEKDDSEPHQEIGKMTDDLTRVIFGRDNVYGDRHGRGILRAIEKSMGVARDGGIAAFLLSPEAFKQVLEPTLPEPLNYKEGDDAFNERLFKGSLKSEVLNQPPISRTEAIQRIIEENKDAAIVFCNGYTAREAQSKADRLGNFYNVGYMGGSLAIGWGLAKSNPDINVVVVDGDQNALMSPMLPNLEADYPKNLQWYILDNGIGASVGTAQSIPLMDAHFHHAKVIRTEPDKPGTFAYPRVGSRGAYFTSDEARVMSANIGPLPVHAGRFGDWIRQQTERNRLVTRLRSFSQAFE